ncbi:ferritin-like domain-containing protein [Myxococcota bacterium]|nr:ferritin-like domain-containing protein [Myxococcota bacterium]MBU1432365.1 ferritin-like domain-containing protein [Myxococcota bacterium]MBU1899433.1 ferritin-like domain-containing protein [Myxococcota bacterium]
MFAIHHSRKLDTTRRRLLRDLTLGSTAFALSACTSKAKAQLDAPLPTTGDRQIDVNLLITEATMEGVAVSAYNMVIPALSAEVRFVAELFRDHHLLHIESAHAHLQRLGAPIPEAIDPSTLNMPPMEGDLEILTTAQVLETQAVNTYLSQIGQYKEEQLRLAAGDILGCEVTHVIALRAALAGVGPLDLLASAVDIPFATALNAPSK